MYYKSDLTVGEESLNTPKFLIFFNSPKIIKPRLVLPVPENSILSLGDFFENISDKTFSSQTQTLHLTKDPKVYAYCPDSTPWWSRITRMQSIGHKPEKEKTIKSRRVRLAFTIYKKI